jgi:hypothetical protein
VNPALLIRKTEFAVHPRNNFECFIEWKGFVDLRRILDQIRQKPGHHNPWPGKSTVWSHGDGTAAAR